MKRVICINDRGLPAGAVVVSGKEYRVEREFINGLDQRVFIILGIQNGGTTKLGMAWFGYNANRFADLVEVSAAGVEHAWVEES